MVANKALLSGTLLVTFISGGVTGYVAQGDGAAGTPQRYTVEYVFARGEGMGELGRQAYAAGRRRLDVVSGDQKVL